MSDDEAEVFEDALEETEPGADSLEALPELPPPSEEELGDGKVISHPSILREVMEAEGLFFTNRFEESQQMFEKKASTSMYHAHGFATVLTLKAIFTMDRPDIEAAFVQLKKSVQASGRYKKKDSIFGSLSKIVAGTKFTGLTQDQLHADLCHVEAIFCKALITLLQDEGIVGFIKVGLTLRNTCVQYNNFLTFVKQMEEAGQVDQLDDEFLSGVYFGNGAINLLMSLLPQRVLKLVNIFGITSPDKELGLQLLEKGASMNTIRAPLCDLTVLLYRIVLSAFLELEQQHHEIATQILEKNLARYPGGAIYVFLQAKLQQTKKMVRTSLENYTQAVSVSMSWRQFHHISYWEMAWCNCLLLEWNDASSSSKKLLEESLWSRSFYAYHAASSLMMDGNDKNKEQIASLLEKVPKYKQKIGGKSIPIEKFVLRKTRKYQDQGRYLFLPGFEMMYMWGYLRFMGEAITDAIKTIDDEIKVVEGKKNYPNLYDDICLGNLLKGVLYYNSSEFDKAEQCYLAVQSYESKIKLDHYVAPYARMELAKLYISIGRHEEAKVQLNDALGKYKRYSMENRLHFRVHILEQQLENLKK